jgi:hypothetical protein
MPLRPPPLPPLGVGGCWEEGALHVPFENVSASEESLFSVAAYPTATHEVHEVHEMAFRTLNLEVTPLGRGAAQKGRSMSCQRGSRRGARCHYCFSHSIRPPHTRLTRYTRWRSGNHCSPRSGGMPAWNCSRGHSKPKPELGSTVQCQSLTTRKHPPAVSKVQDGPTDEMFSWGLSSPTRSLGPYRSSQLLSSLSDISPPGNRLQKSQCFSGYAKFASTEEQFSLVLSLVLSLVTILSRGLMGHVKASWRKRTVSLPAGTRTLVGSTPPTCNLTQDRIGALRLAPLGRNRPP